MAGHGADDLALWAEFADWAWRLAWSSILAVFAPWLVIRWWRGGPAPAGR